MVIRSKGLMEGVSRKLFLLILIEQNHNKQAGYTID